MNLTTTVGGTEPLTMTSRELADLVEKRHDNVKRTIETLVERGVIASPQIEEKADTGGRPGTQYRVGKRDSYVIVAQLSPEFTARLVDRWQELEAKAATPEHQIPQSLPEALRLAADLAEQKAKVEQRLATVAPKAEALDRIATFAEGSMCITNAAKALQMQPKALFAWLQANRWIYRRAGGSTWVGYQSRIQVGYLEHKITTVERTDGSEKVVEQVLVTAKGMAKLAEMFTSIDEVMS